MDAQQRQEEQIRKRVACDERAFHVVLRLLENPISEDYLKDAGQMISPSHYADVIEERSIAKLCGYPSCGNSLGSVPKQRYRISTKSNNVYDITERKKFCSNYCLKASQFFEKQIATSPVWARGNEAYVNFEFLSAPTKSCSAGDAVFLSLPQTELKKEIKKLEKLDHSSNSKEKYTTENGTNTDQDTHSKDELGDNTSNLLSDIVDRMADVKVSYMGEVEGINVDFSEEGVSGEVTPVKIHPRGSEACNNQLEEQENLSKSPSRDVETVSDMTEKASIHTEHAESDHVTSCNNTVIKKDTDSNKMYNKTTSKEAAVISQREMGSENSPGATSVSVPNTKGPLPGESKEDYVLRLLNRRTHLLGQLADIQHSETVDAKAKSSSSSAGNASRTNLVDSDEDDEDETTSVNPAELGNSHDVINAEDAAQTAKKSVQVSPSEDSSHRLDPVAVKVNVQKNIHEVPAVPQPKQQHSCEPKSAPPSKLSPLNAVAKVIEEWVTRDSLKYLGVGKADDTVTQSPDFDRNYALLCKRVTEEEKDFDSLLGEEAVGDSAAAAGQPVPDYKKLEKETKEFELRVREYYKGSFTTGSAGKKGQDETEKDCVRTVYMPMVDSHDQMTIRRKIVLDRLNKVIPDLLTPLQLSIQDVSQLIRELVYTFSFSSRNILFKPGEWSLVGILVMKMLSLNSKTIDGSFKEQSAVKYFSILLSGIGHKPEDLDEIVNWMACLQQKS